MTARARFVALALDGEEVDANHRSPTRRSARPTATAAVGATSAADSTWNFFASNATRLNGSNGFDRRVEALGQHLGEALGARRAAAQHDAVDAIGGGGGLEEVERLLDLEHHVLGDRAQHRPRIVERRRRRPAWPRFSWSASLERQVQLPLQRLGVGVAADRDVAGEDRLVAAAGC